MFLGDVLLEMIVVLLSALIAEAVRTSILSKRPLFSKAKHQYLSVLTFYDNNFTNKNKTAKLYIRS